MKRIGILALILSATFASATWAQQNARMLPFGKRPLLRHRIVNGMPKAPRAVGNQGLAASASAADSLRTWELGTYPGGTWVGLGDINDFGVAVGFGDIADGSTHTLAVPLFGPQAGKWIDLGTLGGTTAGWEWPINRISDTGVIVGHSPTTQGPTHGIVWTEKTGIVDLGSLADAGYPTHNSSYASGVNKLGTLLVGWSGVDDGYDQPVVWMRSIVSKGGALVTKWEIRKLDTTGFEDVTQWTPWQANDLGQIVGYGYRSEGGAISFLWTPLPGGKSWKITTLGCGPDYAGCGAYNITDRGEIAGYVESSDWMPAYWKPLDPLRRTYSQAVVLALPAGYSAGGYADGINELGDVTGACWGDAGSLAARWTTKDATFSQVIGSPTDSWSFSLGVSITRIAVLSYFGDNCPNGCARAVQIH